MKVSCAFEGCEETFESDPYEVLRIRGTQFHTPSPERALRILVVDDDEDLRILARKALLRSGHKVMEASGGAEAWS